MLSRVETLNLRKPFYWRWFYAGRLKTVPLPGSMGI
jgi:hypothetical protein